MTSKHTGLAELDQALFPGPIRLRDRLCYRPPSALSARILWETCIHDADPLAVLLRDLKAVIVSLGH